MDWWIGGLGNCARHALCSWMAQGQAQASRLAPYRKMPLARAWRGELATGPKPFADGGTAQTPQRRGAGAAGGIPTRTMRPHMRMNAQGYAGRKGGGGVAARRDTPTRFMPTVAENASASRATFAGMAGARGDRTRRQSLDCRAVRTQAPTAIPAQGARLGRSPPQIRGRQGG